MFLSFYIAVNDQEGLERRKTAIRGQSRLKFKCEENFVKKRLCDDVDGCESE